MKDNVINPKEIYRDGYLRALRRLPENEVRVLCCTETKNGRIEAEELDGLKGMQKIVGGYIEAVSNTMLGAPYLLIVNEEGKLQDKLS